MPAITSIRALEQAVEQDTRISPKLVARAMVEAQDDDAKMEQLHGVVARMQSGCLAPKLWDRLQDFVQGWQCDHFELVDNRDNPAPAPARPTEVRITKERTDANHVRHNDRTIRPTPPPSRWRDPLNITGHAQPGARVEFYNASIPGRPALGDATADEHGEFAFELTDETRFEYGDQIGIRVVDEAGHASRPVVVRSDPFELLHTTHDYYETNYSREPYRSETLTTLREIDDNTDNRPPFYQDDLVKIDFDVPRETGQPHTLELQGGDDAVEPNCTLEVWVKGKRYHTRADELGQFALKVHDFDPGDILTVRITDPQGTGIDFKYHVPELVLNIDALSAGVRVPPSPRQRQANQVVNDGVPPYLHFETKKCMTPWCTLIMKNQTTDEIVELTADGKGRIDATVGGFSIYDVVEMAVRDANGNLSDRTETAVVLPDAAFGSCLVPVDALNQEQPDVARVIERIQGPPKDIYKNGKKNPHGPFLPLPDFSGMPKHGQLRVIRDGEVIQTVRADGDGNLSGKFLRGINVGDVLDFQVLDAAGRMFPEELLAWSVPDTNQSSIFRGRHVHTEDATLAQVFDAVGTGELDLHDEWLTSFSVTTGPTRAGEAQPSPALPPMHYPVQSFGAAPPPAARENLADIPAFVLKGLGLPTAVNGTGITVSEVQGTYQLQWQMTARNGQVTAHTVGIDRAMGRVNQGQPNNPIDVPGELEHLTQGLRGALAMVAAAYDHGKEPGDPIYDRAMGAAKSFLWVFDRLTQEHADNAELVQQIKDAAHAAMPEKGFPFDLYDPTQVPPTGWKAPTQKPSHTGTRAEALFAERIEQLGVLGKADALPPQSDDSYAPPAVEFAAVVRAGNVQHQHSQPTLHIRGKAHKGDVIRFFNASSGRGEPIAEAVAGNDGSFSLRWYDPNVQFGDQIGMVAHSADGERKSEVRVIETDSYQWTSRIDDAAPIKADGRDPFLLTNLVEIQPAVYDDDGNVRDGGPLFLVEGAAMSAEPGSTIEITSKTSDGTTHVTETEVDRQGRFAVEVAAAPMSGIALAITDANGNHAKRTASMAVPPLSSLLSGAPEESDGPWGGVSLTLKGGKSVDASLVAFEGIRNVSFGDKGSTAITAADRADEFVDVVLDQGFSQPGDADGSANYTVRIKLKVPRENADAIRLRPNDTVALDSAMLDALPLGRNNNNAYIVPFGDATVVSLDFGAPGRPGQAD